MRYIIIFFLFYQPFIWSQTVYVSKTISETESNYKIVEIETLIGGIKLDSINGVKLIGNATAYNKTSNYLSHWFYSDNYLDNFNNKYTFGFDSIPEQVTLFDKIKGTLRYFTPSVEKKSILKIKNGKKNFDLNIIDQNNIKIIPINGLELRKLNSEELKKYTDQLYKKHNIDKNSFIDIIKEFFKNHTYYSSSKKLKDLIIFYIEHPILKVVKININDSFSINRTGVKSVDTNLKINGANSSIWISSNNGKKLDDNFTIEVILENKNSILDFDFELLDVQLK